MGVDINLAATWWPSIRQLLQAIVSLYPFIGNNGRGRLTRFAHPERRADKDEIGIKRHKASQRSGEMRGQRIRWIR